MQSRFYSAEVLCAAVGNTIVNVTYHDLDLDKAHWTIRQILLGVGYTPYHYGATLIAGMSRAVYHYPN